MLRTEFAHEVIGVGYEGCDLGAFLTQLTDKDVVTVVDVRLTPISRKKGFSKRALRDALASVGIDYLHLPELGNPKSNRPGFYGDQDQVLAARKNYELLLGSPTAQDALGRLAEAGSAGRVAVMCFEADQERCHRHVVLEQLHRRLGLMSTPA